MAKNRNGRKRKIGWKQIICGVLAGIVLIACIGGISSCFKEETTKEISSSAFERGGLDENGKYVETNASIYTKEAFACKGLRVVPDFESQITYDVYYYDHDDRFIESKLGLSSVYDEDYPLAQYARIVIHPNASKTDKNFGISWFDIRYYCDDITITVDKDQTTKYASFNNLYIDEAAIVGKSFDEHGNDSVVTVYDNALMKMSAEIPVEGDNQFYDVFIRRTVESDAYAVGVIAADSDDKILVRESYNLIDLKAGEWCKMTIELPDFNDSMYLVVRMPKDADCYIFGYNE